MLWIWEVITSEHFGQAGLAQRFDLRQQVITRDTGHFEIKALLRNRGTKRCGAGFWVNSPGIGNHLHTTITDGL